MSAAYPQLNFDPNQGGRWVSAYPKPGLAQTDPAQAFATSALGDALRPQPDRRAMYQLLGMLGPQMMNAALQGGGTTATSPVPALAAMNPLAAQQLLKPGPITRPVPPVPG